jgi:hypothetical protein
MKQFGAAHIGLGWLHSGVENASSKSEYRTIYSTRVFFLDYCNMETLRQVQTPLNQLFFSEYNTNLIQRGIRQEYKNKTGIKIDYQNSGDLFAIMRVAFINNSVNPYDQVCDQVRKMNAQVIKVALDQINTGVSQYMGYIRDAQSPLIPLAQPINTSTYGKKIGLMTPGV